MDKGYALLNHKEAMSVEDIRKMYRGFWVYVVKAKLSHDGQLLTGIPVVIGEYAFAGAEDGIYDVYKSEEYNERTELILFLPDGFIASLQILRETNA